MPRFFEISGEQHAERVCWDLRNASNDPLSLFARTTDADALKEAERSLLRVRRLLSEISDATRREIAFALRKKSERGKFRSPSQHFEDSAVALDFVARAITSARQEISTLSEASGKRDWRAAAVALECQVLWGTYKLYSAEDRKPSVHDFPTWEKSDIEKFNALENAWWERMWEAVPKHQHHTRPGPFGRFFEEICEVLEIHSADGMPVTAATALSSLAELERQENLPL